VNYQKLTEDLIKAKEAAKKAAVGEDGGSANLDQVTIELPRAREEKVEKAFHNAGLRCFKHNWLGVRYFVSLPFGGQGNANVRATEAFRDVMQELGYETLIYHKMD
jgi:hypothetical protein